MLVEPTVIGVREIARRLTLGQTVAIPSECTYESVSLMKTVPLCRSGHQQSHVYATEHSLTHLFEANQALFPKRQYGFRKDGQVKAIAVFNETFEVTKRLARKVWPGPVIIAISLGAEEDDSNEQEAEKDVYIHLRSPCHPLAVKTIYQYQQQEPTANSTSTVLVGRPMTLWTGPTSTLAPQYITDATSCLQHGSCTAILNGESPQELFHVPPCERGQPPSRVSVNMSTRQVVVSSASYLRPLQQTLRMAAAAPTTLASGGITSTTSVQDQILQAVLQKWTVVQEGISCSVEAE